MLIIQPSTIDFPSTSSISKETLLEMAEHQREVLKGLKACPISDLQAKDVARSAIGHGKALQEYLIMDVSAAMPELAVNDPVLTELISTANDFVRYGQKMKIASGGHHG